MPSLSLTFGQCFGTTTFQNAEVLNTVYERLPQMQSGYTPEQVANMYGCPVLGPTEQGTFSVFAYANGTFQQVVFDATFYNMWINLANPLRGQPNSSLIVNASPVANNTGVLLNVSAFAWVVVPTSIQSWSPYNGDTAVTENQLLASSQISGVIGSVFCHTEVLADGTTYPVPWISADGWVISAAVPYNKTNASLLNKALNAAFLATINKHYLSTDAYYTALTENLASQPDFVNIAPSQSPTPSSTPKASPTSAPSSKTAQVSSTASSSATAPEVVYPLLPVANTQGGTTQYAYITCTQTNGQQNCSVNFEEGPLIIFNESSSSSSSGPQFFQPNKFTQQPFTPLQVNSSYSPPTTVFPPPGFGINFALANASPMWATSRGFFFAADGIYLLKTDLKTIEQVWSSPSVYGSSAVVNITQFIMLTPLCAAILLSDGTGFYTMDGFKSVQPFLYPNVFYKEAPPSRLGAENDSTWQGGAQAIIPAGTGEGFRLLYQFSLTPAPLGRLPLYNYLYANVYYKIVNGVLQFTKLAWDCNGWEVGVQEWSGALTDLQNGMTHSLLFYRMPGTFVGYGPSSAIYVSPGSAGVGIYGAGEAASSLHVITPTPPSQIVKIDGGFSPTITVGQAGEYDTPSLDTFGNLSWQTGESSSQTAPTLPSLSLPPFWVLPNQVQAAYGYESLLGVFDV